FNFSTGHGQRQSFYNRGNCHWHNHSRACDLGDLLDLRPVFSRARTGSGSNTLKASHASLSPTAAPQLAFEPALDARGLQRVLAVTIEALKCARTSAAWWKQKHQWPVADRTMFDRALSHATSVLLRRRNVTCP